MVVVRPCMTSSPPILASHGTAGASLVTQVVACVGVSAYAGTFVSSDVLEPIAWPVMAGAFIAIVRVPIISIGHGWERRR